MIYDGFIFFNEIELLELRLEILNDYVDRFIVVESRKTFTNKDKELNFEKNKDRFAKYLDKIEYVVIDEFPEDIRDDAWDCEHYQRNAIAWGVKDAKDDDILMVSDLDEIVSPYAVKRVKKLLKKNPDTVYKMELLHFWYYLNYVDQKVFFVAVPVAYTVGKMNRRHEFLLDKDEQGRMLPQYARSDMSERVKIPCGGWHFTYMGGLDRIKKKVDSFSHQEYNTDEWMDDARMTDMIKSGKDLFDRGNADFVSIPVGNLLPKQVRENPEKYKSWLCDYRPISKRMYMKLQIKYLCETTWLRGLFHALKR